MPGRSSPSSPPQRALRSASAALLLACLLPPTAQALEPDFSVSGWWRARYHYYDGTPINRSRSGSDTEFFDYRFTIDPVLRLGEDLTLKGRLNILDNVLLGNNSEDVSILTGLTRGASNFEFTGDRDFFNSQEEVDDVQVERLWAELRLPIGMVRIGRQPSNFGLGILANDGSDLELGTAGNGPTSGDTVDRISFLTDLAKIFDLEGETWITAIAYDRTIESQVDLGTDDTQQFVFATLNTNGSLAPRKVGDRELGAYFVYLTNDQFDAKVFLADAYFHLGSDGFFVEGEGVIGTGTTKRGGLIPGDKRAETEDDLVEGLSEDFVDTLNGSLSLEDAEDFARNGFPGFLQTFVATELFEQGFSEEVSLTIAREGVGAALPAIFDEEIDIFIYGGVLRVGYESNSWKFTAEAGYASPPENDDFVAVRAGLEGSEDDAVDTLIEDAIDDVVGEGALTGDTFSAYPFDSEYDVGLILYQIAGPINPASGLPGVINTTYGKFTAEFQVTDTVTTYVSVVAGWLNREIILSKNTAIPGDPVRFVVDDEDDPNEIVRRESFLGVEVDAGVTWFIHPNLVAEIKAGYVSTGAAFGPDEEDIIGIRPQIAILF